MKEVERIKIEIGKIEIEEVKIENRLKEDDLRLKEIKTEIMGQLEIFEFGKCF